MRGLEVTRLSPVVVDTNRGAAFESGWLADFLRGRWTAQSSVHFDPEMPQFDFGECASSRMMGTESE